MVETIIVKGDSYNNFLEVISNCQKLPQSVSMLYIDIHRIRFLKPYHVVILAGLIEEFYISERQIEVSVINTNDKVQKYLENIRFFEYWKVGFDKTRFTRVNIDTTLCLWQIAEEMNTDYIIYARDYFQRNFFKSKDLSPLYISLSEIFNNIFDHSESAINGFVITQYYHNYKKLMLSVCDFGVGIPTKINLFRSGQGKEILEDKAAILKATEDQYTTKSTSHNRGFGLCTIIKLVKEMKGVIKIISNKGFLLYDFSNISSEKTFTLKKVAILVRFVPPISVL